MKRKNIISLLLALTITVGCSVPGIVNATSDTNGNSKEQTTTQEVSGEEQAQSVAVDATVASTFSVSVPKTIQLDGAKKSASYKVTCSGDFPANKKVTVVPEANVTLSSVNKSEVIAAISQNKTEWLYDDHTEGKGTITADTISAGIWNGVFNFSIKFEDTECPENEHDWEYQTQTEKKQELVKDEWKEVIDNTIAEYPYDKLVTESVLVCGGCGKIFSNAEYGSADAATNAIYEHIENADWDSDCENYHSEKRTFILRCHPAEYKTVTVETKVSRTCKKCNKHQERAEFENELE